ncbi:hypothetical protein H2199_000648 [Coniosporium tulheliwenetii]|uniref:Uncharacterized protein n=1 Tax=Coniosporium tulheliwenetii TaxID=3383036 RepID=A0ACC2ZMB9_9PEZI|nr:hypothetical protein H2199_000648 [Cladosporium sp. JES 115]
MSKFGTLVMGPAGAGKTTFCSALIQHLQHNRRSCYYVNLDPAAEDFVYEPDIDIKDLISLEDVMEEMGLGPNGFLLENLDFLTEPLEPVTEEYLIIIDMPGQIELYTHVPILPTLVKTLMRGSLNINMCAAYLLESTFVMDLVKGTVPRRELKRFIDPDAGLLDDDPARDITSEKGEENGEDGDPTATKNVMGGSSFNKLNKAVARLIDEFSMVSFLQLDAQDEDSVGAILSYIDDAIQYHEAQEPKEPMDEVDNEIGYGE